MKRTIALAIALILSLLCCVPALAAQSATLTITADGSCAPGSTIKLTFGLEEGSNIAAANFEVTYDTDTFEYVSYENGELISNSMAVGNCSNGRFLYALAGMDPITEGGALFTLEFVVDSDGVGDHLFYFYTTSCCDIDFKEIDTNTPSVVMTVTGEAVSDVSVKAVTSKDKDGKKYIVSADNGESATGVLVNSGSSKKGISTSSLKGWVFAGVIILLVGGVAFLILSAVARAKKNDDQEPELESILDDDSKKMLDLTESSSSEDELE